MSRTTLEFRRSVSERIVSCAVVAAITVILCGCANYQGRRIQYEIEPRYGVTDPQFLRSMANLVVPGVVGGNRVTGLINGDQIFPAMLDAIRGARKSINFETYIYWSGNVGRMFSDALAERARAGVKVHVLIDWLGSRKIDSSLLSQMSRSGVEVRKYNPLVWYDLARINHRDHRKLLIVDGSVGFIGGAGVADFWQGDADSPAHWRDSQFRLEGPAVAQMQSAFMDNWARTSSRIIDGPEYFPELEPVGTAYAQVFKSSPRDGIQSVQLMYLLSIAAARESIRLSVPYFIPGRLASRALVEACQRGVSVEIIVPGAQTDVRIARHASRSKWGPLLNAGAKIYEYEPTMYHCKLMVVDDVWVSVGSANFDNRSFRLNDEANLNVFAADFAEEQVRVFEEDKARSSRVIYEEWKERSIWKRIMEKLTTPFHSQL
ncbi:MAG: phospholipase D-like domain-containing protein [Verrucomicrobia bacterium]|nr:phospholipase D-like domain-containing protein [Verrucomicrobiota bacterium]